LCRAAFVLPPVTLLPLATVVPLVAVVVPSVASYAPLLPGALKFDAGVGNILHFFLLILSVFHPSLQAKLILSKAFACAETRAGWSIKFKRIF
jgi:hypothetical protein